MTLTPEIESLIRTMQQNEGTFQATVLLAEIDRLRSELQAREQEIAEWKAKLDEIDCV